MVTGKSNFTCLVPTSSGKHVACSRGRCEADWKLSECPHYLTFEEFDEHERGLCARDSKCEQLKDGKLCPYYAQKWEAFRSPVMVANYPFFLTELKFTRRREAEEAPGLRRGPRPGEADGRLASYSLKRSMLQSFQVEEKASGSLLDHP